MTDKYEDVLVPINFTVKMDLVDGLREKAKEVDDRENGAHQAEYTVEQALAVVFHAEPDWLFANVLMGWTVEKADLWPKNARWVEHGTPEGHIIEESPV